MKESREGIERVGKIVAGLEKLLLCFDSRPDWQLSDLHQGIDSTLNVVNDETKYRATIIKAYGDIPQLEV